MGPPPRDSPSYSDVGLDVRLDETLMYTSVDEIAASAALLHNIRTAVLPVWVLYIGFGGGSYGE